MLDAIKHITDDNFSFFQEDSTQVHCACSTVQLLQGSRLIQHLSEKCDFSCFPVLPGGAEAQNIRGGIIKHLLIAYFIGNISGKNIKIHSRMSSQRWDVF